PGSVQHDKQPQESQHHELRVKEVWNHGSAPSPWDDRGTFYLVFGAEQLSAGYRYTTRLGDFIEGPGALLRRWGLGQHTHLRPGVVGDGLCYDPSTFAVGGGEAGDEQGVAEGREIVFRHQGRVRNVEQTPQSTRRNTLPVKLIDGPFLMRHKHLPCALVELLQIAKTPSGADGVLHHPPEAFDGVEVMAAVGRQEMEA